MRLIDTLRDEARKIDANGWALIVVVGSIMVVAIIFEGEVRGLIAEIAKALFS